jgi:hypothetical protein
MVARGGGTIARRAATLTQRVTHFVTAYPCGGVHQQANALTSKHIPLSPAQNARGIRLAVCEAATEHGELLRGPQRNRFSERRIV